LSYAPVRLLRRNEKPPGPDAGLGGLGKLCRLPSPPSRDGAFLHRADSALEQRSRRHRQRPGLRGGPGPHGDSSVGWCGALAHLLYGDPHRRDNRLSGVSCETVHGGPKISRRSGRSAWAPSPAVTIAQRNSNSARTETTQPRCWPAAPSLRSRSPS